jgi:hypothetical protein
MARLKTVPSVFVFKNTAYTTPTYKDRGINYLVTEPKSPLLLIPKPNTGYDPQPVPSSSHLIKKKLRAIPETSCGGPKGCETSRIPHFLHIQLTGVGKTVNLSALHAGCTLPKEDSWYSFLLQTELTAGP